MGSGDFESFQPLTPLARSLLSGIIDNSDDATMLKAFKLANLIHDLFDKKIDDYKNWYQAHYASGVNPFYHQTKGHLILEGSYSSFASELHTPLGYLKIGGSSFGDGRPTMEALLENADVKLKLICPSFSDEWGHYGPWYIVTELYGEPLMFADTIPEFTGDITRSYRKKDPEYKEVIAPCLILLNSLYKPEMQFLDYDKAKDAFNNALARAFADGIIGDSHDIYRRALEARDNSLQLEATLNEFLEKSEDKYVSTYLSIRKSEIASLKKYIENNDKAIYSVFLSLIYKNHLNKHEPFSSPLPCGQKSDEKCATTSTDPRRI